MVGVTVGPTFASAGADDATVGTIAWSNPSRITAEDASSADALIGGGQTSHYIVGSGYSLGIPGNALLVGGKLEVKVRGQGGGGGTAIENSVKFKAGVIFGFSPEKAAGAAIPTGALTWVAYGGPTDTWSGWLSQDGIVSEINKSTFGGYYSLKESGGLLSIDPLMDAMRVTMYFRLPSIPTVFSQIATVMRAGGR